MWTSTGATAFDSIPTRFGVSRAIVISRLLHASTVIAMAALWRVADLPPMYLVGVTLVACLLAYEQSLVSADDLSQVKKAFDVNGYVASSISRPRRCRCTLG